MSLQSHSHGDLNDALNSLVTFEEVPCTVASYIVLALRCLPRHLPLRWVWAAEMFAVCNLLSSASSHPFDSRINLKSAASIRGRCDGAKIKEKGGPYANRGGHEWWLKIAG